MPKLFRTTVEEINSEIWPLLIKAGTEIYDECFQDGVKTEQLADFINYTAYRTIGDSGTTKISADELRTVHSHFAACNFQSLATKYPNLQEYLSHHPILKGTTTGNGTLNGITKR
ncbi:hypothetical protein [Paenibacillus glycanilyticus]|uniref:hypothetical protein n=1 Tax=Paenibacillus glycanilyticus TaxID=126569 RepID=UPI00190FC18B|nr:hypothetical protein [Paenibacillus glycanilyticus]